MILTIDNQPMRTSRVIRMATGLHYYIGGGVHGTPGFVGCMRKISVDGNYKLPTDWKEGVSQLTVFCQLIINSLCKPLSGCTDILCMIVY